MGIGPDTLQFIGRVDEEDKPALYESASVFLFPSLYEGFGLPPLEAMACGTPVISSMAGSLPEVTGEAALSVEPTEPLRWMEAVRRVLGDSALREEMKVRGLAQAARFSWQRAARETAAVYRVALAT
jgi:glycosyltransferase involved in cell wall biosynthesis